MKDEYILFPTPNTMDMLPPRSGEALERQLRRGVEGGSRRKESSNLRERVMQLLPTPRVSMKNGASRAEVEQGDPKKRLEVTAEIINMLPTPNTMEHREIKTPEQIAELKLRSPGGYRNLREVVINEAVEWGKYEPAIRRWETILGRPAPTPTVPTPPTGDERLNPYFAEWLMGIPEGWVCSPSVGLTRAQQLKCLGNGVVPQQAALAVSELLKIQKSL